MDGGTELLVTGATLAVALAGALLAWAVFDIGTNGLARYRRVFTISSRDHLTLEKLDGFSRFEAPTTVRVSASRPARGGEITLHFVNYSREAAKPASRRPGVADERPIAVSGVRADVVIPAGMRVARIEAITPEEPDPVAVPFEPAGRRVRFTMPRFLVYGVARIRMGGR